MVELNLDARVMLIRKLINARRGGCILRTKSNARRGDAGPYVPENTTTGTKCPECGKEVATKNEKLGTRS
jgi:hypothetical protein